MLEIKIVTDSALKKELCEKCSLEATEGRNVMAATDKGEVIAYTVFTIDSAALTLERVVPESDPLMFDGMVRSTLHVAAERGLETAYYTDGVDEAALTRFRFIKEKEEKTLDIGILFADCCWKK